MMVDLARPSELTVATKKAPPFKPGEVNANTAPLPSSYAQGTFDAPPAASDPSFPALRSSGFS